MAEDVTIRTFDAWSRAGRGLGMEKGHALTGEPAVDGLRVRKGARVLDLGCGNGWAARRVLAREPSVRAVGVDASSAMVTESRAGTTDARASFVRAGFESLPFKDATFDAAFSMEALYYASSFNAALREFARVLAPGAHARIVVDYYTENVASAPWPEQVGVPMVRRSEEEWVRAFLDAGFARAGSSRIRGEAPGASDASGADLPWIVAEGSLLLDAAR